MAYGIRLEVWGDYALFTRPELKVERYSYNVMTPSAARGILEAILWKPAIKWVVDKIYVLNPIEFTNIRRNEVSEKISASNVSTAMKNNSPLFISTKSMIQQRASTLLRDVHYVIEAHFEMTQDIGPSDTPEKFYNMALRRMKQGQCYHQPYLGTREFPAKFALYERDQVTTAYPDESIDLGIMLYDIDYSNSEDISPTYFHAFLDNGVLDLRNCEVLR